MDILSNLGGYFGQFDKPLTVGVVSKLTKWPDLQSLGHDGMIADLTKNFHGVKDAKIQFAIHTASNLAQLAKPFAAIQGMILLNTEAQKLMTDLPGLGRVGPSIASIGNLGAVFSFSPSSLKTGVSSVAKLLT